MSDEPPVQKTSILKTWCGDDCVCNPITPTCTGVTFFVYDFAPMECVQDAPPDGPWTLKCLEILSDKVPKTRRIFKVGQPNPGAPDYVTNSGLLGNQTEPKLLVTSEGVLKVGKYHYMFYAPDDNGFCYACNIDDNSGGVCNATWEDVEDVVISCGEAAELISCGDTGDLDYCARWVAWWLWDCEGSVWVMGDLGLSHNCDASLVEAMEECSGLTYGPVHRPNRDDPLPSVDDIDAPQPTVEADEDTCCPGPPCQAWISFEYDAEHCVWLLKDAATQNTDPTLFKDPGEYTENKDSGPILTRYGDMGGTPDKPCPATVDETVPQDPVDYAVCRKQWNDASCGGDSGTVVMQNGIILVAPGDGVGCAEFHAQLDTCLLGYDVPGVDGSSYKDVTLHSGIPIALGTGAAWLAEHGESTCPTITEEDSP